MNTYEWSRDDLIHNIQQIRQKAAETRIIAVLKGNGYGLGVAEFTEILLSEGINFFAVNTLDELKSIREIDENCEVLFLQSNAIFEDIQSAAELDATLTIGSRAALETAGKLGQPVRAHLKIDTGHGRYGFLPNDLPNAEEIPENVRFAGVYTHLTAAFTKSPKHTYKQLKLFKQALDNLPFTPEITHFSNSPAFLRYGDFGFNAVRLGSVFLGRVNVANSVEGAEPPELRQIGRLISRVVDVKTLPKGHNIGYANLYRTKRETRIAIVPVGYMDGFGAGQVQNVPRFSIRRNPRLYAEIGGAHYMVLSRVNMCNIVLDITGADVKIGDKVVLNCSPVWKRI